MNWTIVIVTFLVCMTIITVVDKFKKNDCGFCNKKEKS